MAPSNVYHFQTHWRVEATTHEVSDLLSDVESLTDWWSSVYLEVEILGPGDSDGVGKVVRLLTKGWLPYKLTWRFKVTESRKPNGFSLEARGDFAGQGVWTFEQDGDFVDATYDWNVRADKPLLRYLSFLLKPVFAANHRWAMAQGEERIRGELVRRRTRTAGAH